jgi:GNAT superfamily N-acetyltransferase
MVTVGYAYEQVGPQRVAEVAELIGDVRRVTYELQAGTPAYAQLVDDVLGGPGYESLVRIVGDPTSFHDVALTGRNELVGVAIGTRRRDVDMLEHLFVRPHYQGEGIGRELMQRFLGWSTLDQLVWTVSSNTSAQSFYQHFGFESTGLSSTDEETGLSYIALKRLKGEQ